MRRGAPPHRPGYGAGVTQRGGSGDYVEGERVFAPPRGSFDPDWVAGLVLDRSAAAPAVSRSALAGAAHADWTRRTGGATAPERVRALEEDGFPPATARDVVGAVDDFTVAYGVG